LSKAAASLEVRLPGVGTGGVGAGGVGAGGVGAGGVGAGGVGDGGVGAGGAGAGGLGWGLLQQASITPSDAGQQSPLRLLQPGFAGDLHEAL